MIGSQLSLVCGKNGGDPTGEPNVAHRYDNKILVLNAALQPVATYLLADKWENNRLTVRLFGPRADGRYQIVALADKALVLEVNK